MHRLMNNDQKNRFLKGGKTIPNTFFSFNPCIVKMSRNQAFFAQNHLNR